MPFVLDASVALSWCFEDESGRYADHVLDLLERDGAVVPAIWPLEVANALCVGERRQRLTASDVARATALIRALPIRLDDASMELVLGAILGLARENRLSSYDASYLDLAMRAGLPLATQDARLIAAAGSTGVALVR